VVVETYLIDSNDTTMPIGTLMSNSHLHPKIAVITPRKIIPAAKPEPVAAEKTLRARFRCLPSGKVAARIDNPVAEAIAAPNP
jgi:hypothetical protein